MDFVSRLCFECDGRNSSSRLFLKNFWVLMHEFGACFWKDWVPSLKVFSGQLRTQNHTCGMKPRTCRSASPALRRYCFNCTCSDGSASAAMTSIRAVFRTDCSLVIFSFFWSMGLHSHVLIAYLKLICISWLRKDLRNN